MTKKANRVILWRRVKKFPLQAFFKECQAAWAELPDHRKPSPNTKYALSDAVNSAMSMFFMQSQSFLAHHQAMSGKRQAHGVEDVCAFGRTRWKIENEGINVLKRKGYQVEHNFGHGSQHLAQVFLVLNLLAFLLHTALHLIDDLY